MGTEPLLGGSASINAMKTFDPYLSAAYMMVFMTACTNGNRSARLCFANMG